VQVLEKQGERRLLRKRVQRVRELPQHPALRGRRAPQPPQRLEHGQVRLAGAVLRHALSPADAQSGRVGHTLEKSLDQRRLADPRLAGHEHELTLALARSRQRPAKAGQLPLTSHERRGPRGRDSARYSRAGQPPARWGGRRAR
jgi:hypothetical protein